MDTSKLTTGDIIAGVGGIVLLISLFLPWYGVSVDIAGFSASESGFASNGYGDRSPGGYGLGAALLVEIVLTAAFLYVILGATDDRAPKGFAPVAIGLALTLIHLISIPVTNTSVNPARSTGPAIFVGDWALGQLWLFWVAPIIGAAIAGATFVIITGIDRRDRDIAGAIEVEDMAVPDHVDPDAPR